MNGDRFRVRDNGAGGFRVEDRHAGWRTVTECSHEENAHRVASRLNGWSDTRTPLEEWFRFYRVRP